MKQIVINGNNAKTGGGKTILQGVIGAAAELSEFHFVIIVPSKTDVYLAKAANVEFISLKPIYQSTITAPWVYKYVIPKMLKVYNADLVLNLGDLVISTRTPQSYIFDWAYAVYEDEAIWNNFSFIQYLMQKFKLFLISRNISKVDYVFSQTTVIKSRLCERFLVKSNLVLPIPLSEMLFEAFEMPFYEGKKFLYLSHYYPHKNFEILLSVAELIKSSDITFKIFITIEPEQHKGAKSFLNKIKEEKLDNIIVNLGVVKPKQRFDLMNKCDALLMPTLLETYGIPYIEAMQTRIPIFTSNLDFSKCVCQESAFYFEPNDARSIFKSMYENIDSEYELEEKLTNGDKIISSLPTWTEYLKQSLMLVKS